MKSRLRSLPMLATMLVFVQYIFQEICMRIYYVHFSCQPTPQLQNYSRLWMIPHQENWIGHFVSVYAQTSRRAAAMTGRLSGSITWVKEVASECESMKVSPIEKCWLAKKMHLNLTRLWRMWLKLSTTVKYMPLTHMCSRSSVRRRTPSTHLPYTEVRRLSKGGSLARVFDLWEPLQRFLLEKQSPLAAHFRDTEWVATLAYLCDIFNPLNKLNLSLQGRTTTVIKSADKVAAFKAKLEWWGATSEPGFMCWDFWHISNISRDFEEPEPGPTFSQLVHGHLSQISEEFKHYFPTTKDPRPGKEWICNPFVNEPGESTLSVPEEDQLLEIANDGGLKSMCETTSNLHTF